MIASRPLPPRCPARPHAVRRRVSAILAGLALAQLAAPASAHPMRTMMVPLCGSGVTVPLPVPREDGPDGDRGKQCQMPCHGVDRRRKAGLA